MGNAVQAPVVASARPLVAARTFSAGVTFFIPLALARLLDIPEYGTFKQFFLLSHTLYLALGLGVPQSLYYFLPRHHGAARRAYLGQTLIWLLGAGAAVCCFLLSATQVITWVGGAELAAMRVPMAIFSGCLLGAGALEAGLTAQGRPAAAAVCYVVSDAVKTAAFILPAFLGFGLQGVLWGAAFFAMARLVAAWAVLSRRGPAAEAGGLFQRDLFREQLRYALPYGGAMLLAMPQQQFHQYVVSVSSSPELFAVYAVGCFNLPVVDLLYTPTTELLMYRIGELSRLGRPEEEAADAFREAVWKLAYAFLPMAAGLFAIAPAFLAMLYTEKFLGAAPIFRIALVVVVLACLPVDGVLRAKARTRALLVSNIAKIAFSVPLTLALFRAHGPIGAMMGFAGTEAVHKSVLLVLAARALRPELAQRGYWMGTLSAIRSVIPLRHVLRAGGAAAAAAALALAATGAVPMEPLMAVLVIGTGFWVVYGLALMFAGVRPAALLAVLRAKG